MKDIYVSNADKNEEQKEQALEIKGDELEW